jgi:hypothetical protein
VLRAHSATFQPQKREKHGFHVLERWPRITWGVVCVALLAISDKRSKYISKFENAWLGQMEGLVKCTHFPKP